jgi:hypothetical protein
MIEALLALMLEWKTIVDTDEAKLSRYRPLVTTSYRECERYAKKTKVSPWVCMALGSNTAYWETGLNPKFQLLPKVGPSGEECYFQIHRLADQIPFDEWKPLHAYGTRHGEDIGPCVQDGIRILSYHLWRCRLTEDKLLGTDNGYQLYILYSQYYLPTPDCKPTFKKKMPKGHFGLLWRRARMAKRLLKKLREHAQETK